MTLPDSTLLELHELCSALIDGTLDGAQRARLNALLEQSAAARACYVRTLALSASLHEYAGELQVEDPEPVRRLVPVALWRWGWGTLAAAAALVLAFSLRSGPTGRGEKLASGNEEDSFVATLSATTNCRWTGAAPLLGEEMRRGQQLQLAAGLAEITFHSGAQLVVEGPAALELSSPWEAVLRRGSLRANVPPEAIGFRIANGDVEVVDLGTEFSMVAGEAGGTEVFVLKGAVQAGVPGEARPVTLHERQARRFDRASSSEVGDREQKLKKWAGKSNLVQFTRPAGYLHWSFDERSGAVLHGESYGLAGEEAEAKIVCADGAEPLRVPGRRGLALAFDGRTYATAQVARIAKRAGATMAFWTRLPGDAEVSEGGPMLALLHGVGKDGGAQITWNRDPAQGVLGALRTELESGPLVGSTTLRDSRWHHVAVVLEAGGRARQYVDGRLEAATAKRPRKAVSERPPKKARDDSPEVLALGRAFPLETDRGELFRGDLDELFLADRALTPPEIRQLLRENRPAAPRTIADAGR